MRLLAVLFLIFSLHSNAQYQWGWMNGSGVAWAQSIYGPMGVGNPSYTPGMRFGSATWTDNSGNLWLFGGISSSSEKCDLWKYTPSTNQWTWVKGSSGSGVFGTYGTMGVGTSTTSPGCRAYMAFWKDSNGDFWLYGGYGWAQLGNNASLADLWKYNIASNQWTWMGGSPGVNVAAAYGTKGVPSATNTPGNRRTAAFATDASGNLWLFGGERYNQWGIEAMNDLWKYDHSTLEWTWVSGSTSANQAAVFGTKGVASSTNSPQSRYAHLGFTTPGSFWFYGGVGMNPSFQQTGYHNDLWRYDISSGQWTWVSGQSTAGSAGSFGLKGVASPSNEPMGMAFFGPSHMIDNNGDFLVFGGTNYNGWYNDLWRYNISSGMWTWCKGNNTVNSPPTHGTYTIPDPQNEPGSRYGLACWKDNNGRFWFSGGQGIPNGTNELWLLDNCALPSAPAVSAPQFSACSGSSLSASAVGNGTLTWFASPYSSVALGAGSSYTSQALVASSGNSVYGLYAGAANNCGVSSGRSGVTVTVFPLPVISAPAGTICSGAAFTIVPSGAVSYTVSGGSFVVSPPSGTVYLVTGTSSLGCVSASAATASVTISPSPTIAATSGSICAGGSFVIVPSGAVTYSITGNSFTVSPAVTSTFAVSGSNGCASQTSAIATVSVHALPVVSVSGGTICNGDNFVIAPTGALTYSVSGGMFTVSPSSTTVFMVSGTSAEGCESSPVNVQVDVNPLPVILIAAPQHILCKGEMISVSASGAVGYTWNAPGMNVSGGTVTGTALQNTTLSVQGTDINNCTGSAGVNLLVDECASVNELPGKGAMLFPNPTTGIVLADASHRTVLRITDMNGRLMLLKEIEQGQSHVDLRDLPCGVYAAQIDNVKFRIVRVE